MDDYILIYDYTPLIRLSDEKYPVFFPDVRQENPNTGFPIPIRDTILIDFGYKPVLQTIPPMGNVVTEGKPEVKEDGNYYQTWNVRDFTPEEKANNLRVQKEALLQNAGYIYSRDRSNGFLISFKGLEYRVSASAEEITFLLSLNHLFNTSSEIQVTEEDPILYKFVDNQIVKMSKEEFDSLLANILTKNYDGAKEYWSFIDNVNSINDITKLPPLPETFFTTGG